MESPCKPFPKAPGVVLGTKPASGSTILLSASSFVAGDVRYATKPTATGFDVERTVGGQTLVLASIAKPVAAGAALPIAPGADGKIVVAGPDAVYSLASDVASTAEILAEGFAAPHALFFDRVTRDLWLVDREGGADVLHRIRSNVSRLEAPGFFLPERADGAAVVIRDGRSANLEGRLVYTSQGSFVVVDPFGPAGPPIATSHPFTGGGLVGITSSGSAIVQSRDALAIVEDTSSATAPRTLSATGCVDPSAIAYDVASPLWSDGAEKERAVLLPSGTQARVLPDGDLKFPVGTIAIKTFARGGKKIETRLFVQHALDDWVGYSYAWNAAGTDADLVVGNASKDGWYFPSSSDCNACHTAAAGFTLGLEARQLDESARTKLAPDFAQPAFTNADARAYLHSNCSSCHREGNATGTANLDLREGTPLANTGLCKEPKLGTLGIEQAKARIVAPGSPAHSVLVKRMRALDETRMPKLGASVVDESGVALVERWISSLLSCP